MQETRRMRLQSAIQQELSQFVAREVKDPRIPSVTFTEVQVTEDGEHAVVFVAILGRGVVTSESGTGPSEASLAKQMRECIEGLNAASGYMRRHLAKILTTRHIPSLAFKEDRGFENATRVHELLSKLEQEKKNTPAE